MRRSETKIIQNSNRSSIDEVVLLSKELLHQSRFYLNNVHFLYPASTLPRTISSIQVPLSQELFNLASFYLSNVLFIIQLLLSKKLLHQSSFYLNNIHFVYPASTLPRTIS